MLRVPQRMARSNNQQGMFFLKTKLLRVLLLTLQIASLKQRSRESMWMHRAYTQVKIYVKKRERLNLRQKMSDSEVVVCLYISNGSLLNKEGRVWFKPPLHIDEAIHYTHQ